LAEVQASAFNIFLKRQKRSPISSIWVDLQFGQKKPYDQAGPTLDWRPDFCINDNEELAAIQNISQAFSMNQNSFSDFTFTQMRCCLPPPPPPSPLATLVTHPSKKWLFFLFFRSSSGCERQVAGCCCLAQ
jgi:hypothetical protein